MTSTVQTKIGATASDLMPFAAASDAVVGAKVKEFLIGTGRATPEDTNKQLANIATARMVELFRAEVKHWHVATARTAFESSSRDAADAFLDVDNGG